MTLVQTHFFKPRFNWVIGKISKDALFEFFVNKIIIRIEIEEISKVLGRAYSEDAKKVHFVKKPFPEISRIWKSFFKYQ